MATSIQDIAFNNRRRKRISSVVFIVLSILVGMLINDRSLQAPPVDQPVAQSSAVISSVDHSILQKYQSAQVALNDLAVKGRAPKTNYKRTQFGNGWQKSGSCDTRNKVLARDMTEVQLKDSTCVVLSGILLDPYTGKTINFIRGDGTSAKVQIDHVVALSDAWQKGAQQLTPLIRESLANDGMNLLAVDGPANMQKSDGDAATWLPSNKPIRCAYVARQISVKLVYALWVTSAEKDTMNKILSKCPNELLSKP